MSAHPEYPPNPHHIDLRQAARGPLGAILGLKRLATIYDQVGERDNPEAFLAERPESAPGSLVGE